MQRWAASRAATDAVCGTRLWLYSPRGGSMILVPKISPHGLSDPSTTGLFKQLTESASLNTGANLVRGFRISPRCTYGVKRAHKEREAMVARIGAFLVAFALVTAGAATAQERYGTLTGAVTDQQGQPVPGVAVTITNTVTGEARTHVTDSTGHYLAADLNPGRYKVEFVLTGFARVERPDVSVLLGRTFVLTTQMRVGALTETVQVTAEAAPLIDTRTTLIAHNVPAEEIELLPKGRSFQSIALTAPSVNSGEVEGGF